MLADLDLRVKKIKWKFEKVGSVLTSLEIIICLLLFRVNFNSNKYKEMVILFQELLESNNIIFKIGGLSCSRGSSILDEIHRKSIPIQLRNTGPTLSSHNIMPNKSGSVLSAMMTSNLEMKSLHYFAFITSILPVFRLAWRRQLGVLYVLLICWSLSLVR